MMKQKGIVTKSLALSMALAMTVTNLPADLIGSTTGSDVADLTSVSAASKNYALADNIQEGTILHCFDWTYNDIKAMLPQIAEAGFTSVQTSPAQPGVGYYEDKPSDIWYWLYQPLGYRISNDLKDNPLGTKAELQALCDEAEKYGINVIVDVIANHLAGKHDYIDDEFKDDSLWHHYGPVNSWNDRWQVTHCEIGMPDIDTNNSFVQQKVEAYIRELKSIGVDGIRWDTAKHISLPSEGCNFWPTVTDEGIYNYGEILRGPDDSGNSDHLMLEYTKYMSVTDSDYGKDLRDAFNNGTVFSGYGNWAARGVSNDKLVYWGESHDTWSNNHDWGYSNEMSQNVIDRAYAVAASREDISALYFSRPSAKVKDDIRAGQKGSTHFTSPEVAAVNHFHNAMIGQDDFYTTGSNCAVVCREQGAVIVAGSGSNYSVTVPNGGSLTKPGTYTDEITGNTWTVTSSTISGKIGDSGIAVIYNPTISKDPEATISKEGGNFSTDTLELTLGLKNATSGTYQIGNGSVKTFTSSTKVTIGSDMSYGDSVTVKLTATNGEKTVSDSFTFTKVEQTGNVAYFSLPSGWGSTVYCYAYDSATETINNGAWPGQKMTKDSATGYYLYEIP